MQTGIFLAGLAALIVIAVLIFALTNSDNNDEDMRQ